MNRLRRELGTRLRLLFKELENPRYSESEFGLQPEQGDRIALLARLGPDAKILQRYFIYQREFWLGRDRELCDLYIASPKVCLKHARICQYAGNFYIEDLASRNGTYVGGRQIPRRKQILLADEAYIRLADIHFYFQVD